MEDFENNWIILDLWGTICKIYANLTAMSLLNLSDYNDPFELEPPFKNTSWIMFKTYICIKHIFHIYENPRRKNFIKPSCNKHPKIINWNKKLFIFYNKFYFL